MRRGTPKYPDATTITESSVNIIGHGDYEEGIRLCGGFFYQIEMAYGHRIGIDHDASHTAVAFELAQIIAIAPEPTGILLHHHASFPFSCLVEGHQCERTLILRLGEYPKIPDSMPRGIFHNGCQHGRSQRLSSDAGGSSHAFYHIAAQRGCAHKAVGAVVYAYGVVCRFTPQTARGQKFIASLSHKIQRQRHVAQFKSA